MLALLSWTKLPQWALELIFVLIVAFGVWYALHARYEAGIRAQQVADAIERTKLESETAEKTAALRVAANEAQLAYEKEHQANLDYRQLNPTGPVRLCIASTASGGVMPETRAAHPGNAAPGASAPNVHPMPPGNIVPGAGPAGPDISELLGFLSSRADDVSAVLREYQAR